MSSSGNDKRQNIFWHTGGKQWVGKVGYWLLPCKSKTTAPGQRDRAYQYLAKNQSQVGRHGANQKALELKTQWRQSYGTMSCMRNGCRRQESCSHDMTRRFINFLTVASLALFIAVAVLWVRSYFVRDSLVWTRVDNSAIRGRALLSWRCRIGIAGETTQFIGNDNEPMRTMYDFFRSHAGFQWRRTPDMRTYWVFKTPIEKIGFVFDRGQYTSPPLAQLGNGKMATDSGVAALPDWLLLLLTGILPIRWARTALRQRNRRRLRLCLHCGYDLRATADHCPECGVIAPPMDEPRPMVFDVRRTFVELCRRIKLPLLMIGYWAATFMAIRFLEPNPGMWQPSFTGRGSAAMLIVFFGAFHLAKMSRRPMLFLVFGAVGAVLLIPPFIENSGFLMADRKAHGGFHYLTFVDSRGLLEKGNAAIIGDVVGCIAFVVAIAVVARLCAMSRWRYLTPNPAKQCHDCGCDLKENVSGIFGSDSAQLAAPTFMRAKGDILNAAPFSHRRKT